MILSFIVSSFATWRIASLLVRDDGPFDLFQKLRSRIVWANNKTLVGIFGCIGCLSVYVGLLVALLAPIKQDVLTIVEYGLALSAVAILFENGMQALKRIGANHS